MAARPLPEIEDVSFNYADLLRRLTLSGEELLTPSVVAAAVQNLPGPTKPSGSPGQLQDASSLDSNASGQISLSWGGRSPGKASPFRGRTMKEYEEQLATLKKDNFALKLRIYFLEERMGQKCDRDDKDDLYRTNIELKVETEALKQELYDKQELVRQASTALASLEHQYQEQLDHARRQHAQETQQLNSHVQALQKEVESYADQLQQGAQGRLGELTQLCGLAFSTEEGETALAPSATSNPLDLSAYPNPLAAHSPVQGVFSLPSVGPDTNALKKSHPSLIAEEDAAGRGMEQEEEKEEGSEVEQLRERVVELEGRVEELEEELAQRQDMSVILQEDLDNLRKEVEEKVEKIGQLEQEVAEKDERVEVAMQELEMQHSELAAKDHLIQSLHQDLHREPHLTSQVEPEIEVKVQEIVERDRIIEEKIEQIEQQNKILVEIQITLDEKQKQLADMEQKVEESEQKVTKLTQDLDKSCKVIQSLAEEVHARDKEIANLKKELKRKEKKVRDLVAELKETLDMLKKAKWEAETSGGEDGVKEMAEEENERLWAELESRKNEVLALQAEHKLSLAKAHDRLAQLQEQLDGKLKELENQKEVHTKEIEEREAGLQEKAEQVARLEGQLQALQGDMSSREGQLKTNQDAVDGLHEELGRVKAELQAKKAELQTLQEELKKKNADMQDLVNRELWERNREVERLQDKLASLTASTRGQLDVKDEELMRLRARLAEEGGAGKAAAGSVAQVTVVTGSCGPDMLTMNRPLNLSLTEDSIAAVQLLQREVNLVREEARALRLERSDLNNKLSSLQQLHEKARQMPATTATKESGDRVSSDSKEEIKSQVKEQQSKSVCDFQSQVEVLCGELQATKRRIGQQMTQVNVCKYKEALRRHKQEITSLRKRLADSHNACDLLRTRLEELADFLERILELEEQGHISLSQLCPSQLASMHKTLDESRALSRSLSMSLMIGVDLTDQADPTLLSLSTWSLADDNLSETYECPGQECYGEEVLQEEDTSVQGGCLQMELKTKEFEALAQKMSFVNERLAESTQQVREQAKVISELRAEVTRLRDQAQQQQQQQHSGSSADLSEPLPPPPLHLLQDSEGPVASEAGEGCVASDRSNRWGAKSGSSTDTAIKAHSYHLGYLQQQQQQTLQERRHTEGSSRLGPGQEQVWAPVSPSESEAWSEPDRNVSLARIGLDTSSLGGAPDRSTSRSRQHRSAAALTSESEAEAAPEDPIPAPLLSPASASKASKRRSDVAELRRVTTKLRAVEQLNDTLRAELNIYQTLNQQLLPPSPAPRPATSDKSVETHKGETADAAVGAEEASPAPAPAPAPAPGVLTIPTSLLEEIRGLRGKLEEAITNNDQLRDQLEAALTAHPQDEARFLHLTVAIQTAQEEQREAREKLQASQTAMKEQEEKCQQLSHKLQQSEAQLAQQQQQLEAAHQQTSAAQQEASQALQGKEVALKEQAAQLTEREEEVKQLQGQVTQLQEQVTTVGKLQEKLQRQETRLLEVNKERMSLVGERARLQAQLASASTQARLQESHTSVLQQLEAERSTVATLQKEREYLVSEKERLEKGTEVLREEVANLQAKITYLRARHSHGPAAGPQQPQLQQALPQQQHNNEYHKNSSCVTEKLTTPEDTEQCVEQQAMLMRQLTAQLEAERQLTANLQLQLKTLRNTASACPPTTTAITTTAASPTHCHDSVVEAISSPESVTSIEYYPQPLPDPSMLWRRHSPGPAATHSQRERRSTSSGRRRERDSSGRRVSSHWSENKENIYMSSTLPTTTTTTTTSSTTKRSRLSHTPLHHSEEEDIDGGTTSGESPDLGIGSDHHFSSLERGTTAHHHRDHHTAAPITRIIPVSPPPPTPLCSEPSHSALTVENQQLREESENLKVHLASTKETLKEALDKLCRANQRKENVERAICKQLHKTHDVLKKAKSHLKQVNTLPQ
ncbi:rootletin-like isoform X3 [Eriocheir sinensis]|uniref:rootletin-like isoform X3 n=1 Tax=Eriocheir sinensis TaxID=95602 RepID=UPI0021C9F039|nr:rootletin-like isoform X3 [Eriocheir sinensis]